MAALENAAGRHGAGAKVGYGPCFLLHKRKTCLAAANMSVCDGLRVDLRCNDVERQLWAKLTFSYGSVAQIA